MTDSTWQQTATLLVNRASPARRLRFCCGGCHSGPFCAVNHCAVIQKTSFGPEIPPASAFLRSVTRVGSRSLYSAHCACPHARQQSAVYSSLAVAAALLFPGRRQKHACLSHPASIPFIVFDVGLLCQPLSFSVSLLVAPNIVLPQHSSAPSSGKS